MSVKRSSEPLSGEDTEALVLIRERTQGWCQSFAFEANDGICYKLFIINEIMW